MKLVELKFLSASGKLGDVYSYVEGNADNAVKKGGTFMVPTGKAVQLTTDYPLDWEILPAGREQSAPPAAPAPASEAPKTEEGPK